jgi:hypothetical protein
MPLKDLVFNAIREHEDSSGKGGVLLIRVQQCFCYLIDPVNTLDPYCRPPLSFCSTKFFNSARPFIQSNNLNKGL